MKYHIWTVGCQMNVADSRKLAAGLDRAGLTPVDAIEDAGLVVLNTCSVREHAEDRAIGQLGRLKKLRSRGQEVKIAVMGCMVGLRDDDLRRRFPYVDAFARPQDFAPIMEIAGVHDTGGEFWPTTFATPDSVTAFVPVIHGCDKFCTYCIVPYRRGREKSRTVADITGEVEHYCARGVREITLLGQTVEAYGRDLPGAPDLGDLMRAIHDVPSLARIRFLTSYPKDMTPRTVDAVAELPKVCENFNIPVQAGDDAVLERMRRGYTLAEYLEKFDLVKSRMPGAAMVTDVIVGFCGETDAEFTNTYALLERLRFDKVHVAAYSPRPGTIAHRTLPDDVPAAVKQERLHAVEQLEARVSLEINRGFLDTEQEVLVESRREGRWTGRNRLGKLIHFEGVAEAGQLVTVRIAHASAWSLQGTALPAPVPA
ncbi:MAG: tRNA (N6-isopentenyl adenosine(37)-C2)-methylthiotransferase MiaB [Chloroflexi bacterium]|nr:tRNA (N6-isopentenyl adenosine(37)-C2)-methylthiotransferase MiaB [Chloroflexota bacterium]